MGVVGNGIMPGSRPNASASTARAPRRLVLLAGGDESESVTVLREYQGPEVSGTQVHADLQALAQEHHGRTIAAEWQGSLGWVRFLWCRK